MSLVSHTIPNMINGISQQPDDLRLPTQCTAMVNAFPSVIEGLIKRPPTTHVKKIIDGVIGDCYLHTINRDMEEIYNVYIFNWALKVFDINGLEYPVNFPSGGEYINNIVPSRDIAALTVADHTFIVNKKIETEMDTALTPTRIPEAMVFIKQATYRTTYKITLKHGGNTLVASFTTATGEGGDNALSSEEIAQNLGEQILNAGWNFGVAVNKSTIFFHRTSPFDMTVEDTRSNTCIVGFRDKIQRFSDLPAHAFDGYTVEITGESSSHFNNYWVRFKKVDGLSVGDGVWEETVKPGIKHKFKASTMPHVLVREADGTFTFRPEDWATREAGDEESAPEPSFIGHTFRDVVFYRNRLGFLADTNLILSRTGEFYNFWPETMTAVLATDPVDTAAGHTKVSILNFAVPFQEKLLCFSGQTQFSLSENVTPQDAELVPLTEFESTSKAKPVTAGKTLFFAVTKGDYTGIKEYFMDEETQTRDAIDITSHVPKYVPGDVFKMAASSNEDILLVLSKQDQNSVYFYKYFWAGNEKMQSAWGKWSFLPGCKILNAEFIESRVWLVVQYDDGVYMEYIDLSPNATDPGAPFLYHLDRKINETGVIEKVFDPNEDCTTFQFPWAVYGDVVVVSRHVTENQTYTPGDIGEIITQGEDYVTVEGNWEDIPVYIGVNYAMTYQFSKPVVKAMTHNNAPVGVIGGRLQVRNWSVLFNDTGYFRAEVQADYRPLAIYPFTGTVLGSGQAVLGQVNIADGKKRIPVMSRNDRFTLKLINDTYLPSKFLSAEWEGLYTTRSSRV